MARTKNRVLNFEDNGNIATIQLQLEDGQVVKGHYKVFFWLQPPEDVAAKFDAMLLRPIEQTISISAKKKRR
jgi:hypothetical protein